MVLIRKILLLICLLQVSLPIVKHLLIMDMIISESSFLSTPQSNNFLQQRVMMTAGFAHYLLTEINQIILPDIYRTNLLSETLYSGLVCGLTGMMQIPKS